MRIKLILVALLLSVALFAQKRVTVKGRVVNEKGEAVEYVQLGVPKLQVGTVSTADGRFEIEVPCDTLEFYHVSYEPAAYPVTGPANDIVIVLRERELPPALAIAGKTKEKYLVRPGVKVLGDMAQGGIHYSGGEKKGYEVGSIANTRKPFLVRDIQFTIQSNDIPGCVAAINIYRIEGEQESFVNVLHRPIYVEVPLSQTRQYFDVQPGEMILLEPGKYFIGFQIIDADKEAVRKYRETPESERKPGDMCMYMTLYFKSSYERDFALGEMHHYPVNIGIAVKGLEYQ